MTRRLLLKLTAAPLILLVCALGYIAWIAKRAEPDYSGRITLPGLTTPVRIRYGAHAVPTIVAKSLEDLVFAQGYVVASERMWQMDLMRRLAAGRLAKVFGEAALPTDRFFRTIGLSEAARHALADLDASDRSLLQAYAAGVNAYRERAKGRLPLEYWVAGFTPAPWRPEDSLVIGQYMAWLLSGNVRQELVFLRLAKRLGAARATELFPIDEGIPATTDVADFPELTDLDPMVFERLLAMPARWGLPVPAPASNAWAVTGRRTADQAALLANDPHLKASMPSIWYELELHGGGLHAAGVALPGIPLILIGHNADLAWGFTTTVADTQDLFLERLTPDGRSVIRAGGVPDPILTRRETIAVKGRTAPLELRIRHTHNGVIINDILERSGTSQKSLVTVTTPYLLALRSNLEVPDRAFSALIRLNTATTLEEARRAVLGLRHAAQNAMLAHRDGGIAWQVTGLLPRRGRGSGLFPSPGWEAGSGWTGYVPQSENPGLTNPSGDVLITANNRTIPADSPINVGQSWLAPYRAQRIQELLAASKAVTPQDMARMQLDRVSIPARHVQQALRRLEPQLRTLDPQAWHIAELLLDWDASMEGGSRPGALLLLLRPALYQALYGDELGTDLSALMSLDTVTYTCLDETVHSGRSSFWDDVTTPQPEGPAEIWVRALHMAWERLQSLAPDPEEQRLAGIQTLTFHHAFDPLPILGRLFSVGPQGAAGGNYTINVMKGSPSEFDKAVVVPSLRVVYTPADWHQTRGTLPLGQSGHRLSPYRTDQLADWWAGRSHPLPWNGPPSGTEIGTLTLEP